MSRQLKTRWMELLGYAGLIPFLALAALTALNHGSDLTALFGRWNLLYGACIVSFLGAVHWGMVLVQSTTDHPNYLAGRSEVGHEAFSLIWGVTPALIAWVIVAFSPADWSAWLMGAAVLLSWIVDQKALQPLRAFQPYLRLRTHLSMGAVIGLWVTAAAASMV